MVARLQSYLCHTGVLDNVVSNRGEAERASVLAAGLITVIISKQVELVTMSLSGLNEHILSGTPFEVYIYDTVRKRYPAYEGWEIYEQCPLENGRGWISTLWPETRRGGSRMVVIVLSRIVTELVNQAKPSLTI